MNNYSFQVKSSRLNVENIATTTTLTEEDSGKVFAVAKAAAYTITLPAVPSVGWHAKFYLGIGAFILTFNAGSAIVAGTLCDVGAGPITAVQDVIAATTVTHAASALVSGWVEFIAISQTAYRVNGVASEDVWGSA